MTTMAIGALGAHGRAHAQTPTKIARIGWLSGRPGGQPGSYAAFLEGLIADGAVRHRLPASCPFVPQFAEAGGLIAYGPNFPDLFRRSGDYVGRILKGATASDLPVQRPEKFELVVNVKTARALRLTLPVGLVQRADRVIE